MRHIPLASPQGGVAERSRKYREAAAFREDGVVFRASRQGTPPRLREGGSAASANRAASRPRFARLTCSAIQFHTLKLFPTSERLLTDTSEFPRGGCMMRRALFATILAGLLSLSTFGQSTTPTAFEVADVHPAPRVTKLGDADVPAGRALRVAERDDG